VVTSQLMPPAACLPPVLLQLDKCFGYETAVEEAQKALLAAHVEASSAYRGIGLVKLMGRHSGFIAVKVAQRGQGGRREVGGLVVWWFCGCWACMPTERSARGGICLCASMPTPHTALPAWRPTAISCVRAGGAGIWTCRHCAGARGTWASQPASQPASERATCMHACSSGSRTSNTHQHLQQQHLGGLGQGGARPACMQCVHAQAARGMRVFCATCQACPPLSKSGRFLLTWRQWWNT
jgi:hypothetical protein